MHYTAPWHQQENVFLPSSRPPCVEDLHRQAKLNLKSVLRGKMLLLAQMCLKGAVVFATDFPNLTKLRASEETYLFFCLQHIRNVSGIYPLKSRDRAKMLLLYPGTRKCVTWQSSLE